MKKKYLDLQKANMAALKQQLREHRLKEEAEAVKSETSKVLETLEMIPNVVVEVKSDGELDRAKVQVRKRHLVVCYSPAVFSMLVLGSYTL